MEVRQTDPDGRVRSKMITIRPGESKSVTFEATPNSPTPIPPAVAPSGVEKNPRRTLAFVALGGAAVGVAASALLGVAALDAKSDYEESRFTSRSDYDRANGFRDATNIAWITTGVLGAAGLVLYLTSSSGRAKGTGAGLAPWHSNGPVRIRW